LKQVLKDREHECGRLSRARLGQAYDVPSLKNEWDRFLLYWGWGCVTNGLYSGGNPPVKRKLFEIQKNTPWLR